MALPASPAGGPGLTLANRRLNPCKDCGHLISLDAVTCPKCGSKEPRIKERVLPECMVCKISIQASAEEPAAGWGTEPEPPPVSFQASTGLKTRGGFWVHDRCAQRLMALNRPTRCSDCDAELPSFDLYPYSGTIS